MKKIVTVTEVEGQGDSVSDTFNLVRLAFEGFGYRVLARPDPQDNECDMYVVGLRRTAKIEIKVVRELSNGTWQAAPITERQRRCDICAVVLPNNQVFLERMDDYLLCCSDAGYRAFTWLKL